MWVRIMTIVFILYKIFLEEIIRKMFLIILLENKSHFKVFLYF